MSHPAGVVTLTGACYAVLSPLDFVGMYLAVSIPLFFVCSWTVIKVTFVLSECPWIMMGSFSLFWLICELFQPVFCSQFGVIQQFTSLKGLLL